LLGIEEDIVHAELNKSLIKTQKDQFQRAQEEKEADDRLEEILPTRTELSPEETLQLQEKETIRLLINYGGQKLEQQELHFCHYLLEEIKQIEFQTPVYQKMLQAYRHQVAQGQLPAEDFFIGHADVEIKQEAIALLSNRHEVSLHWKDKFQIFINIESDDLADTAFKSILRLKRRLLQKMMEEAMQKIKEAEQLQLNDTEVGELQELYLALKKVKLDIDKELGIVIG
jgi:DNA primase